MKIPRDYQEGATAATFAYFDTKSGFPLIVAPVGSGKSLLMAEFIRRACLMYRDTQIIVLTHDSRLLVQDAQELLGQWPEANISFYSDKLKEKNLGGQIIFASIQSIYKKALMIRGAIDLVLVDECHLISPESDSMYRKFFAELKLNNPYLKVIGYTGTPFRAGKGFLHQGENALFTDIAYEIPMGMLIEQGHLCPLYTPRMRTQMDTTGVGKSGGDFIPSQLARAVDKEELTRACVDEIVEHGSNRRKWLIFATDVKHAEHIRDEVRSRGFTCEAVHSKLPEAEQAAILRVYEGYGLRCLVNVAQLTTGFNNPAIDLLAFMRPTRSPVLYIQCCGRAMRTHPNKVDALVLDFGGVVRALGPVDKIEISPPRKRKDGDRQAAPSKKCPACLAEMATSVRACSDCGHEFPPPSSNLESSASDAAILSTQIRPKPVPVTRVFYSVYKKEGRLDTLRVDYQCGLKTYREWVCFNHSGDRRQEAANWWFRRAPQIRTPNSVEEAARLAASLPVPESILIRKAGEYWEVVDAIFEPASKAG